MNAHLIPTLVDNISKYRRFGTITARRCPAEPVYEPQAQKLLVQSPHRLSPCILVLLRYQIPEKIRTHPHHDTPLSLNSFEHTLGRFKDWYAVCGDVGVSRGGRWKWRRCDIEFGAGV
jgi:hypothetical protein